MEKYKFKTTIKCTGCLATVTPPLNAIEGIQKWEVDLDSPDRVLSVEAEGVSGEEIVQTLKEIGYNAQPIAE